MSWLSRVFTYKHLIYVNLLLDSMCWTLLIPTLPGIHRSIGLSTLTVGSISSLVSMITFLTGTVQGKLADQVGKVTMLRLSSFAQLLGHILLLLSLHTRSIALYVLARCVQSACKCCMVVSQALLHDRTPPLEAMRSLGTLVAFSNLSFILGPFLGGLLYNLDSRWPCRAGVLVGAGSLFLLHYLGGVLEREDALSNNNSKKNEKGKISSPPESPSLSMGCDSGDRSPSPPTTSPPLSLSLSISSLSPLSPAPAPSSLSHCLHLKFAFQLGNSLFEALLPQYSAERLRLTAPLLGGLLSWSGALSAFTNIFLLKQLLQTGKVDRFLSFLVVGLGLGLGLWALSSSFPMLCLAVSVITVSSNLFLGILQGKLSELQRHEDELESGREKEGEREGEREREGGMGFDMEDQGKGAQNNINLKRRGRRRGSKGKLESYRAHRIRTTSWGQEEPVPLSPSPSSSSSPSTRSGAIYGLSSTMDRGARILSPLLGSLLVEQFGPYGLLGLAGGDLLYCMALLHFPTLFAPPVRGLVVLAKGLRERWRGVRIWGQGVQARRKAE